MIKMHGFRFTYDEEEAKCVRNVSFQMQNIAQFYFGAFGFGAKTILKVLRLL